MHDKQQKHCKEVAEKNSEACTSNIGMEIQFQKCLEWKVMNLDGNLNTCHTHLIHFVYWSKIISVISHKDGVRNNFQSE